MAILAPSLKGLGSLLEICGSCCLEWDICLNVKKSRVLYFGKRTPIVHNVELNGKLIPWASEWPYLGVMLKSDKVFSCCVKERVRKFYRATNAILRIEGRSNDMIMLRLLETHCVPVLSYAIEVVDVIDRNEKRSLRVAYNSIFRKIFGYRYSESVTALQGFLEKPTWEQLIDGRKRKFENRVRLGNRNSLACAFFVHNHN